ncbi:MAG: hypothetical protein JO139_12145 [Alphaproteobacteria bacterium]|nr:hypothetical protein [Alphaproteobacteria bacterium]
MSNAVGAVVVGDVAGLSEMVDAERDNRVAGDRAEPRQGRWMEVADRDQCCTPTRSMRSKIRRRLTQGPRLVETVISGDVVTMRSAPGRHLRAAGYDRSE